MDIKIAQVSLLEWSVLIVFAWPLIKLFYAVAVVFPLNIILGLCQKPLIEEGCMLYPKILCITSESTFFKRMHIIYWLICAGVIQVGINIGGAWYYVIPGVIFAFGFMYAFIAGASTIDYRLGAALLLSLWNEKRN